MLKAIVFGLAAGAGFQGWRNYPPDQAPTANAMLLVFGAGLIAAYCVGRGVKRLRGPVASAVATAVSSSRSKSQAAAGANAQVQVVLGDLIAQHKAQREAVPGVVVPDVEGVEWMRHRQVLEHQDLDGMDLSELVESEDIERIES